MSAPWLPGLILGVPATISVGDKPQPPRSYPASVVSLSLQAVWDLQFTAGLSGPLLWTPAAPNGSLPSGTTISGNNVHVATSASFTDYDFSGYTVWVDGTITASFTNCKFGHPASNDNLSLEINQANNGSATVTLSHCLMDQSTGADFYEACLQIDGTNAIFTMSNSKITNASCTSIALSNARSNISLCYWTSPAQNSAISNHADIMHYYNGNANHVLDRCLFDNRKGAPTCGLTSMVFAESLTSSLQVPITNCIFAGVQAFGWGYPLHVTADNAPSNISAKNCAIEYGIFGAYCALTQGAGQAATKTDLGGNRDFDTNVAITI